jgi:hypothetical protein
MASALRASLYGTASAVATLVVSGALGCGGTGSSSSSESTFQVQGSPEAGAADASLSFGHARGDGGPTVTGSATGTLAIAPLASILTVTAGQALPTQQFTATVGGEPTAVGWSFDRGEIGSIDGKGLFTPAGSLGGVGHVTARYGLASVSTTLTVVIQKMDQGDPAYAASVGAGGYYGDGGFAGYYAGDAGAGGYGGVGGNGPGGPPSPTQLAALESSPTADSTVSLVYPYSGTVWPQGLLAPLLQWQAGAHLFDSAYVQIQEKGFQYKGYFASNASPFLNLPIPQDAWDAMAYSNGGDPVTVTLVLAEGTKAYGPYTETWNVAQAPLQGEIYYQSYGTSLVKNSATDGLDVYGQQYGAGTLGITSGATSPVLVAGISSVNPAGNGTGCRVCHTVAAQGSALMTQASNYSAGSYADSVFLNLANDVTGGAGTSLATDNLAFPALYKDGSLLFSGSGGMIDGDTASQLYALPSGSLVNGVSGLPAGLQASLPAFSPDGAHVSFNFWSGTFGGANPAQADQISLAVFDFDGVSTFTNPRVVYTPINSINGNPAVTYSSFLPDSSGVVFEVELSNPANSWGYTWNGNTSELWWVDLASGASHRLDQLNGYDALGNVYLPNNAGGAATHSSAEDATLNYEPTVNPIASGGYAWVVFTSRRMYGNVAQLDPWTSDPRKYPWLDEVTDKKLWVAAIDLNAPPGTDPSHPAFYLPAQELHAGNARGYWSVQACRADGQTCMTGTQCCGGYCQGGEGGLVCSSQVPACAAQYEKCAQTSDCCGAGAGITCVNDVCTLAQPPVPQ